MRLGDPNLWKQKLLYSHDHVIKMVAIPIYCKHFQKLLLQNRMADIIETWYAASGTQLLVCSNDDPRLTFGLYTNVNFGSLYFCMLKWWNTPELLKSMI